MKRLFGFMLIMFLTSICYGQSAPPIMISGIVDGYNVAGIDATIKNGRTGFTTMLETNSNGEFHYTANPSNWNCNDNIQISILGITEVGYMDCDGYGNLLGYVDSGTGLVFAKFDFSGSCPICSCQSCDGCCPDCICDCGGGGTTIVQDCSEGKCSELFPCEVVICDECEVCQECELCSVCEKCDECKTCDICETCEECPVCDSSIIMQILGIIFGIVAGAGISLCVYRDKDGKLKFTVRMHRHEGRQYLHPTYRVHRAPYTHEYCELMPKYEYNTFNKVWVYVSVDKR